MLKLDAVECWHELSYFVKCSGKRLLVFCWQVLLDVPLYLLDQCEFKFFCWSLGGAAPTTLLKDCTNMVKGLSCSVSLSSLLTSLGEITAAYCLHKGLKQAQILVPGACLHVDVRDIQVRNIDFPAGPVMSMLFEGRPFQAMLLDASCARE
eukprot:14314464-Ditylum_brightwellii.AAC.1